MKKILSVLSIALAVIFGIANSAFALITCPAGSHTFSGGTQASGYDMCITDVGSAGPVSGSSAQPSATFTPSTKGTINTSGTTAQTQAQGITIDTQVDAEVNRLYGTKIYAQAKALYDASVLVSKNDFNSVSSQIKGLDDDAADSLKRAYNVRAIERLNQVWNQIIALETTYAEELKQQAIAIPSQTPTAINPNLISATPINPTPTGATEVIPTPIVPTTINSTKIKPTPIVPTEINATDLTPSQIISALANKPTVITRPNQSIYLQAGSVIKYVNKNVWQTVSGAFRFLEKTAIDGRYKVRTNGGAVVAVRGTQFIINETAEATTVTLIKGALSVTPAQKGKPVVNLKEGYQLVITDGVLGKPVKFDAAELNGSWHANILPSANFTNASWKKTAAANNWRSDCAITAGQATATQVLTADEQAVLDYLNQQVSPVFKVHEIDTFVAPTQISVAQEKTTINKGAKAMNAIISGKSLYYSGDSAGKIWKVFKDKDLINSMLQNAKQHNIVYYFDQNSLAFDHWDKTGNTRIAVYQALATQTGTDNLTRNALSSSASSSPALANVFVYVNEDTEQWTKTETSVNYPTGKIIMPIYETCKYAYGAAKIKAPAKAKLVTAKAGLAEMGQIYNAAQ